MEKSENNIHSFTFNYEEAGVVTVSVNMSATAVNELIALETLKDTLEEEIRNYLFREKSARIFEHVRKIAEELGYAHLSAPCGDELAE